MKSQVARPDAAYRRVVDRIPDGVFLVRVQKAQLRLEPKSYYRLTMTIIKPSRFLDQRISSRLYRTPRALWKLNWFLRDFGYGTELLGLNEVDETELVGLNGVVKIGHVVFNGTSWLRLDGFAPVSRWEELSPANLDDPQVA
jgi:hypothetical protein